MVQRVSRAKVTIKDWVSGEIGLGVLVLLGVGHDDTEADATYLAEKIAGLRIFEDESGKMNRSVKDAGAGRIAVHVVWGCAAREASVVRCGCPARSCAAPV